VKLTKILNKCINYQVKFARRAYKRSEYHMVCAVDLQCRLRSIPELTFIDVGRLETLDLSDNLLQHLTQRSLAGLHAHLETINLDNNRLRTLDRCVFDRFRSIDVLKVGVTLVDQT